MSTYSNFSRGSEWRKWDLHIHTPASIVQSYGGDEKWEEFITALEHLPPEVKVIGINDYYFIDGYEKVMQYKKQGRLSNIEKIFSVLEFRIDTFGSGSENKLQKVNLHIIFNINEDNLENEIQKIKKEFIEQIPITRLEIHKTKCLSKENFISAGNGTLQDGFSSFIPPTDKVFELLNNPTWNNKYFLLLGYKEWSNLEKNNQLKPLKDDLYRKVNAFFTSNYESFTNSKTWLNEYGEKPLLHSRDIHGFDVLDTVGEGKPAEYCCNTWIKADPTFEGLRQIMFEPLNRVFIGEEQPDLYRENIIKSITVDKEWFSQKCLPLNDGLVSIIGQRGSGKTALLDFIALGAGAYNKNNAGNASFLLKAENEVKPLIVKISMDGQEKTFKFDSNNEHEKPLVQYLSQQFVESLCSIDGSTERLQMEIERFIFENIDEIEHAGASDFSELKNILCQPSEEKVQTFKNKISNLNLEISRINNCITNEMPAKRDEKSKLEQQLKNLQTKLPKLDKLTQSKSLQDSEIINEQILKLQNELKQEYSQLTRLKKLYQEILDFNTIINEKNNYFQNELLKYNFDKNKLRQLFIQYPDVLFQQLSEFINIRRENYAVKIGDSDNPKEGSYNYFMKRQLEVQQKVNAYTENEKFFLKTSKDIKQTQIILTTIDERIKEIEGYSIENVKKERIKIYQEIFKEISNEKKILEKLYEPLVEQLKRNEQEKHLGFFVKINVDLNKWAKDGEELLDLRRARDFSDHEKLFSLAREKLLKAWENCDIDLIGKAIDDFTNIEAKEMSKSLIEKYSVVDLANWLFSTDHIKISYEITFDGLPLKRLSPGTKGIVLMLLYLGIDKNDTRPLLIDQPEDNLDPESVYSILVPYFLEAKKRRQIIIVTHNPNLVVVTDSDQVIIAKSTTEETSKLPTFSYMGGGLENPEIVKKICSILEGGKDAFRKRENRYFEYPRSK